jgi:transporter family-2 protein
MKNWIWFAWAVLAGSAIPLQAGVNGNVARALGSPLSSALISIAVSLACLALALTLLHAPMPAAADFAKVPSWHWIGGVLGIVYLGIAIAIAPRLGAASFIAAAVAGQMLASLLFDHFGVAGFAIRPLTLWRVLGLCMVIGGALVFQLSPERAAAG